MKLESWKGVILSLVAITALIAGGCGQKVEKEAPAKDREPKPKAAASPEKTKHEGWWCAEHGVPEEECSRCSDKVAAQFKKKKDWCEKHKRAMSQCFICDPKAKERYAAIYRANNEGKEPPPIEDDEKKDDKPQKEDDQDDKPKKEDDKSNK